MVLSYMDPKPMPEPDNSTVFEGVVIPPEVAAADVEFLDNQDPFTGVNGPSSVAADNDLDDQDPFNGVNVGSSSVPWVRTSSLDADKKFLDDQDPLNGVNISPSSVPWPGSTFIIRSVSTGDLITLLDGQIVLAQPEGRGSIHWVCVETKGWIGFRNSISGRFLGHDAQGKLCCAATRQQGWENFCVRFRPEGGYMLLMTHFERLWEIGIKIERGVEKLAKIGDPRPDGIVWEFVKV